MLHHMHVSGQVRGDPKLGVMPMAAEQVILICVFGSAVPAYFNTRGESWAVAVVTWGGLVVLNLALMIPGCSLILG